MTTPAIPRSFTLPGGFRIRVRYVAHTKLQKLAKAMGVPVGPDEMVRALWDEVDTIYLTKGRHPMLLALDFRHELDHALTEWRDWWDERWGVAAVIEKAVEQEDEAE